MPSYTSDVLIDRVKEWQTFPTSQGRFTDQDIIDYLNEQMYSEIVPVIQSVREEYLIRYTDQTIAASTYEYTIPTRAMGASVVQVAIVDPNETNPNNYFVLPRINMFDQERHTAGYYLKGSNIVLRDPGAHSAKTLRVFYVARPNNLVLLTATGKVTAISGNVVTVDVNPITLGWTTSSTFDCIQGNPHFDWIALDQSITARGSTSITFTSVPSTLAVNDYVALKQESPIAQIPVEAHNLLCQATVVKILEARKDNAYEMALIKYESMKKSFLSIITPRASLQPKKFSGSDSLLTYQYWEWS